MAVSKYTVGSVHGCYEIVQRVKPDGYTSSGIRYSVRCIQCRNVHNVSFNSLKKYAKENRCVCEKIRPFESVNVGETYGIYTVLEIRQSFGHKQIYFKCDVCGHVRQRLQCDFVKLSKEQTECNCSHVHHKEIVIHENIADTSKARTQKAIEKYKSFIGQTVGSWKILGLHQREYNNRKGKLKFYWVQCVKCKKFRLLFVNDVLNSKQKPICCTHKRVHIRNHSAISECDEERLSLFQTPFNYHNCISEYSSMFGTPFFIESVAQASIDGTLSELNQYFCLDGIYKPDKHKDSQKAVTLAFRREFPHNEVLWYNETGTKRIRHFRSWKHGKRSYKHSNLTIR